MEDSEFDTLFKLVSLEETARAWCSYEMREHPDDEGNDPDWWAVHLMIVMTDDGGPEEPPRTILTLIAEFAENDDVLGVMGAGPLEAFISDDEGRIRWIEAQAAASENFRKALAAVWVRFDVTPETFARLEGAAGVKLGGPGT
ncbi:MAG TPA: hypothetical protein VGH79_00385 [Gaiellaceae bacterium]